MYSLNQIYYIVLLYMFYIKYTNSATGPDHGKVVVCYLVNWSVYRPGRGSFAVEHLDPSLCTHVVYSFVGLNISNDSIYSLDEWQDLTDDFGNGGFNRVVALKNKNPHLTVTVAIGGWDEGSTNYSILAADPERRSRFVINAVDYVRKYQFDGLDVDWESPGKRNGSPFDKQNFVLLIKELRMAFNKYNLLLTATFGSEKDTIDLGYNVKNLSNYLDYVHLQTFDYHGDWDCKTGANAPLRSNDEYNVEYSVKYMIELGMDPSKLLLGIPLYGRTYYLTDETLGRSNPANPKLGLKTTETGFQGPFSEESGFLAYNELCTEFQNNAIGWSHHWDDLSQTPFAINNDKVIVYDNERSYTLKVNLAIREKLGGVMAWNIDNDDFRGDCSVQSKNDKMIINRFPLMKIINKAITNALLNIEYDANEIKNATKGLFVCPAMPIWCQ